MWAEWKPATFFSTLIRDFQMSHVVHLTPGSGAMCLASLYSKTPYTGLAYNDRHEKWLRDLLQRMFVSMVISKDVVAHATLHKRASTYLNCSAEATKAMLPKFAAPVGDSIIGLDDSDVDERFTDRPLAIVSLPPTTEMPTSERGAYQIRLGQHM